MVFVIGTVEQSYTVTLKSSLRFHTHFQQKILQLA